MTSMDFAFPVRPGEHVCCRFAHSEDRVVAAASESVRRLVGVLGWDTDPTVQVGT